MKSSIVVYKVRLKKQNMAALILWKRKVTRLMLIAQVESEKFKIIQWAQPQKRGWKENSIYLLPSNILSFLIRTGHCTIAHQMQGSQIHVVLAGWVGPALKEDTASIREQASAC